MIQHMTPLLLLILVWSCHSSTPQFRTIAVQAKADTEKVNVVTGAEQLSELLHVIERKPVAMVVNQTSIAGKTHLVDTLLSHGANIKKILAPEHGFRGTADAGEKVKDVSDAKSGLPVLSLYGSTRKPTADQLKDVEMVIFDIQDVGVRFFTYISTLHYVMEACAEYNKTLIVLDRPNPHGDEVDGPVLDSAFRSFVGMHRIPLMHGLTIGELAKMINGEGWLPGRATVPLHVIAMKNYTHDMPYSLPVRPSPNLPDDQSVKLYPSTCFLEGTVISVGRGTQTPFQVLGHPDLKSFAFHYTPVSIPGMAKEPPYQGKVCYGIDLRKEEPGRGINLSYLMEFYKAYPAKDHFFNALFDKLAGTDQLRAQLAAGMREEEIKASWQEGLNAYRAIRNKYMLYP